MEAAVLVSVSTGFGQKETYPTVAPVLQDSGRTRALSQRRRHWIKRSGGSGGRGSVVEMQDGRVGHQRRAGLLSDWVLFS